MSYVKPEAWVRPVIEKGVPIPPLRYAPGTYGLSRSPWAAFLAELEVGDSFVIHRHRLQMASTIAKRLGIPIATDKAPEGVRVWRVDPAARPVKPKRKWNKTERKQQSWVKTTPSPSAPTDDLALL